MVQGKIQDDSFIRQQEKKSQEKPYCFPARRAERIKNKLGSVDELMMAASARKQAGAPSGHEDAPGIRKRSPIPSPTPATHTRAFTSCLHFRVCEIRMLHTIQEGIG